MKSRLGSTLPLKFDKGPVLDLDQGNCESCATGESNRRRSNRARLSTVRIQQPAQFLNLRLRRYCVRDESVYGANFEVRRASTRCFIRKSSSVVLATDTEVARNAVAQRNKYLRHNPSIRQLLTEIAAQSGKAGWMAHLKPEELKGKQPFWKGLPLNEHGTSPITGHWFFFDLNER